MIKKIILSNICFIFSLITFGQNYNSATAALNIFSNNEPFILFLNGIPYNDNLLFKVRVEGLPDDLYEVRVIFKDQFSTSAVISNLEMYNEIDLPLDLTLLAQTNINEANRIILYSFFPIQSLMPSLH